MKDEIIKNLNGDDIKLQQIYLRGILDSVAESIYGVDIHGICTFCNKSFLKTLGYKTSEEVIGKSIHELIHHHHADGTPNTNETCLIHIALKKGEGAHADHEVFWKADGKSIPVEYWAHPQFQDGVLNGNVVTFIDISYRKMIERREQLRSDILELMYKAAPLRSILEKMVLAIESEQKGMLGSILILNKEAKQFSMGVAPNLPAFYNKAVLGVEIGNGVGSCGTAAYIGERVIVENIKTHKYWNDFKELAAKAGLGSCWSEPIKDRKGKILGTFAIYHQDESSPTKEDIDLITQYAGFAAIVIEYYRDAQNLIESEEKYRQNEEKYRTLVENAPEALVVLDFENQKFISVSQSAVELFKMSKEKLLSIGVSEVSPEYQPDGRSSLQGAIKNINETINGGKPTFEWIHCDSTGKPIPCEVRLVRLPSDNKILIRGSITDITERKKTEQALQQSEERYRELFNNLDAGVVVHAPDTSIIMSNPKASELLGLSEAQMQGKKAIDPEWKFLSENNAPLPFEKYPVNQIVTTKKPIKNFRAGVNRPESNDIVWLLVTGFPVFNYLGEIIEIVISFIDITERRRIREERMEHARFLKETQLIANLGTYTLDIVSGKWTCSEILDKIFGIDSDFDKSLENWPTLIHPDWRKSITEYFAEEVIGKKKKFDREYKIVRINDKAERWVHGIGRLKLNENNQPIAMVGTISDITDKKKDEEEVKKSRQELRNLSAHLQTIREEESARISREIHDDLGQQLTGLKMDAHWLTKKISTKDKDLLDKVENMNILIDEAMKTLRRIAAGLRPGILDDLGLIATLEWQCNEFSKRTNIKCTFESRLDEINIETNIKTGIFRVCQEALTNITRHAKATVVEVTIEKVKDYIILSIKDNGIGFDVEEIKNKKSLGLIGMNERAIMMGGELMINSGKGKGGSIVLQVPAK